MRVHLRLLHEPESTLCHLRLLREPERWHLRLLLEPELIAHLRLHLYEIHFLMGEPESNRLHFCPALLKSAFEKVDKSMSAEQKKIVEPVVLAEAKALLATK